MEKPQPLISVFMPARNEGKTILQNFRILKKALERRKINHTIIVIDGSQDQTREVYRFNVNTSVLDKLTDGDRKYPKIFKKLWGNKLIHQKCLLHLNKNIVNDFGKTRSILNQYNKYLLLNIFYNREKELKFLKKLLYKYNKKRFIDIKIKNKWVKEKLFSFKEYVKKLEHIRRRKNKNLSQRPLWKAKQLFKKLWEQRPLFSKVIKKRLKMIKKNWKFFTVFYSVKNCPATNNAIENFYSTKD